ncbi:uncharacterized protein F5147DRAFT_366697 [Suillus discolor]|uniref:Uncharacterized protein n=1 Tax=Suillus discolor TaxID=1912936 RepID=A0A9P7F086_9AGAM|nr:uncharacterized protein F5147DRAFT_366697 [Suillus discolor]KAG2097765.1 hypothetical protein F5147DRAFT_366697 [Suillus discolor]
MFTSRFTILTLLTFLAGANAGCATCNRTLEVGTTSYRLVNSTLQSAKAYICTYEDNAGDVATCEYYVVCDFWRLHSSSFSLAHWPSSERRLLYGWGQLVPACVIVM